MGYQQVTEYAPSPNISIPLPACSAMKDVIVKIFDGGEVIASEPLASPITAAEAQKGIHQINMGGQINRVQ